MTVAHQPSEGSHPGLSRPQELRSGGQDLDARIKTIGLLRFSVLTPTYYSERFKTLDETAAHLFSAERMELRFRLFEHLCLPSLLRQSDRQFDMVILTAERMPAPYLERLAGLLAPHDNMHLVPVGTDNHYKLLQQGYNVVPADGASHRCLFRLDDDDALDRDYVARLRRLAAGLLPLQADNTPFVLAFNRGFYLRDAGDDAPEVFDACERAPLSAGTAIVAPARHGVNPYRFNHRKYAQHFNTYSDISCPSFLRTIHGDNKSSPAQMGLTHRMSEDEIEAGLRAGFDLTVAQLKEIARC